MLQRSILHASHEIQPHNFGVHPLVQNGCSLCLAFMKHMDVSLLVWDQGILVGDTLMMSAVMRTSNATTMQHHTQLEALEKHDHALVCKEVHHTGTMD